MKKHPLKRPDWLPTMVKLGDATLQDLAFDILVAQGYTKRAALRRMAAVNTKEGNLQ